MMNGRSFRLAAFACVAGLVGVACGGTSSGDDASAPASAADTVPAATSTPVVDSAPADAASDSGAMVPSLLQFTAPLIGGGEIVGDELAGKPTAFWFWSPT
jgi:hypothetical protein